MSFARIGTSLVVAALVYTATAGSQARGGLDTKTPTIEFITPARADGADLGFAILKCFHPTASFVRATFGDPAPDAPGRTAQNGQIDFRGGFSGTQYSMQFVLQRTIIGGDRVWRVVPGADNAPFVPNPSCQYRNWTH